MRVPLTGPRVSQLEPHVEIAARAGVAVDLLEIRPLDCTDWVWTLGDDTPGTQEVQQGLEDHGDLDDLGDLGDLDDLGAGRTSWLAGAVDDCVEGTVRPVAEVSARGVREALAGALASALFDSGKRSGVAVTFPPRQGLLPGLTREGVGGVATLQCAFVPTVAIPAAPLRNPSELCSCHSVPLAPPPAAAPPRKCRVTGRKTASSFVSSTLAELAEPHPS